jgi:FixJ family two-component response regulator
MTGQRHIILAEDETHARTTLALIFKKAGYKVTAVEDGQKTFALLQDAHHKDEVPDLLLTDFQMPGLNGIELSDELKKDNIVLPILVITGFGNKEMVFQRKRKGCNDFIEKPFEQTAVLYSVNEILASRNTM